MNSQQNDIFYKVSDKKRRQMSQTVAEYELGLSSSIFTSSTPSKGIADDMTETEYVNNKLTKIHKNVLDSDFLPLTKINTKSDESFNSISLTGGSDTKYTSSAKNTSNSSAKYTSETVNIPINYSESSTNISPYYSSDYKYKSSDKLSTIDESETSFSSTSSTSGSTSSHTTYSPIRKRIRLNTPKKKVSTKKPSKPAKILSKKKSAKGNKKTSKKK